MMCQRIGIPPISTIGFGRTDVSSPKRVPKPPARITACIEIPTLDYVSCYSSIPRIAVSRRPLAGVRTSKDGAEFERLSLPSSGGSALGGADATVQLHP